MNKLFKLYTLFFILVFSQSALAAELILNSDNTFIPTHENRFSFMLGINPSLTKSADMTNFSFAYSKKMDTFWLDTNFLMSKGLFRKFSANNPAATGATDEELYEQKNTLTTFGIGIGRESRYFQTLLPFSDIYEFMAADLTYNVYKEDLLSKSFKGPGLLAKFSLYKKFNEYFSLGTHFNYQLAVVKRALELEGESNSDRSLTLGFLTLGIDLSFYL